jgi:hypothetical protein
MSSRALRSVAFAIGVAAAIALPAAAADRGRKHGDTHQERHHATSGWHDRDIHRFHEHDLGRWRGGRWYHGRHGGHEGWWWIVAGLWYLYPSPVYPYPNPYQPPVVVGPPPPAPPPVYYYCDDPPGYYPYVPTCRLPWRMVPAQ